MSLRVAFIGGGNMAQAIIAGLLAHHYLAQEMLVVDINPDTLQRYEALGLKTASEINESLSDYDIWVLAVKPQQLKSVAQACQPFLKQSLVISIAAGISTTVLSTWLGGWANLVRAMPNTPALVGAGATGLFALDAVSHKNKELAANLFEAVGMTAWVEKESLLDAVTAVSGSGPAYVFYFLEAMIAEGQRLGLSQELAQDLAYATFSGAVSLAMASDQELSTLRQQVTSKGGTTAAAIASFEHNQLADIVAQGMQACAQRAETLAQELGTGS